MEAFDLQLLRDEIDKIDELLLELLSARFRVTAEIGSLKAQLKLRAADPGRESQQMRRYEVLANRYGVNASLAQRIFRSIIDEVVSDHQAIAARSFSN
ncbi:MULTISPECIES: chorismate mutase [Oxalobacteraceae]|jgi:chorismate mutase|uniref:chorismate mutase n=1 Tax=Oxalobacteraceae TaxID=75682 RepID=UPI002C5C9117|nr:MULTISPECIES: chorismate mutase [Oxalobacteraceae]HTD02790.1 chorismate mutase [Undibacterium sp.]HWW07868.1 chorismate mutase [Collimonas sp.]